MSDQYTLEWAPYDLDKGRWHAVPNQLSDDRTLSWAARGVMSYLLGRPQNWIVQPNDLEQQCSRKKVYSILQELRQAHYLALIQERAGGKIVKTRYLIFATPYPDDLILSGLVNVKVSPDPLFGEVEKGDVNNTRKESILGSKDPKDQEPPPENSQNREKPGAKEPALDEKDEHGFSLRRRTDPYCRLKDKIAIVLFGANPCKVLEVDAQMVRVTAILHGDKKRNIPSLLEWEMAYQENSPIGLSRAQVCLVILDLLPGFSKWYYRQSDNQDLALPAEKKFLSYWSKYRSHLKHMEDLEHEGEEAVRNAISVV